MIPTPNVPPGKERFDAGRPLKSPRRLIGLMSGTSVDGIDAALVEITGYGDEISVTLIASQETSLHSLREPILAAAHGEANSEALCRLHAALGEAFANAACALAKAAGIPLSEVEAIGCHGQTVWHAPEPVPLGEWAVRSSLQLGNPAVIAARTGCTVVSDFRSADLALGGQGAPLVPIADWLLLQHPQRSRAVQNLGGIGNVTYLPAGGRIEEVIAFDTGPGNMILDALAVRITGGQSSFDRNGEIAAQGRVCEALLEEWLREPYFSRHPPKSTGRELFGSAYVDRMEERGRALGLSQEDVIATATALTAESMARAYRAFLPPVDEILLGGGGVRNATLRRMIEERLAPVPVLTQEAVGGNSAMKEAVAFALLADRTLQRLPGNVPQATGASRAAILGSITLPP